jgi:hypothetical protein
LKTRKQENKAFSSGRRCHEVTDEVFYGDCSVEHHEKSLILLKPNFSFDCRQNCGKNTPHPPHKLGTFSHWRRLTKSLFSAIDIALFLN